MSIATRSQKTIVERDPDGGLLIMHETGDLEGARDEKDAMRRIQRRAKNANPGMTITTIEWRDGLVPPDQKKGGAR